MGKITRILSIFSLLSTLVFVVLIISLNNDLNTMKTQNILFLIVDENKEVEVALGMDIVGGNQLFIVDPTKAAIVPEKAVGSEVSGSFGFEGKTTSEKSVRIGRVLIIKTSVLEKLVDMVGGVNASTNQGSTFAYRQLSGKEATGIITSGSLEGSGTWSVATIDPVTSKGVMRSMSGAELQDFLVKSGAIPTEKWMIKFGAFKWVLDGVMQKSAATGGPMPILKAVSESYKSGEISTYPSNTLTTVVKILPIQAIEKLTSSYREHQESLKSAEKG